MAKQCQSQVLRLYRDSPTIFGALATSAANSFEGRKAFSAVVLAGLCGHIFRQHEPSSCVLIAVRGDVHHLLVARSESDSGSH